MKSTYKTFYLTLLATLFAILLTGCHQQKINHFQGYVEGELITITSPFSGTLQKMAVVRGEKVTKDQQLFTLDPQPQLSQFNQAEDKLTQAKATLQNLITGQRDTILQAKLAQITQGIAELNLARLRKERLNKLYVKRAVDRDSVDAAESNYLAKKAKLKLYQANYEESKLGQRKDLIQAQQATVAAAQAALVKAKWSLDQKSLTAPLNATVFDTFFRQGEWVSAGKPILALLAPKHIRIIFFVPTPVLAKIKLGQTVDVSCDACQKSYSAKISYISPQAEYTPPVIYSRDNNYKLVYRIKAIPKRSEAMQLHPGQPVYVDFGAK